MIQGGSGLVRGGNDDEYDKLEMSYSKFKK